MKYRFLANVVVDGRRYSEGDIADERDFPPGCLASCIRVSHVVPAPMAPPVENGKDKKQAK